MLLHNLFLLIAALPLQKPSRVRQARRAVQITLLVLLCAAGFGCGKSDTAAGTSTPDTTAVKPIGKLAASGDSAGSEPPQIKSKILMLYEKSGQKWIEEAVKEVNNASGSGGSIKADYRGSREGKQAILYGKFAKDAPDAPVLWNPADTYWFGKLNQDWKDPKYGNKKGDHTANVVDDPKTILNTRLVLVMWKDRAAVFQKAMQTPKYQNKTWSLLRDLATTGWSALGIGAPATWGKLKLAQSSPIKSNSGQATLRLIFDEYLRGKPSGKSTDPEVTAWIKAIEGAVKGGFADTTSNALTTLTNSPATPGRASVDMAIAYEQNVLALADSGENRLQMVYPAPTLAVNFPVSVVKADWVSARQFQDARAFTAYLLSPKVQERATGYGFRPGDDTLSAGGADKLNTPAHTAAGFQVSPSVDSSAVSGETIDSLLFLWNSIYGDKSATGTPTGAVPGGIPSIPFH